MVQIPDEIAQVMPLVAGGDELARASGLGKIREKAILALAPGTFVGAGLVGEGVRAVEDDAEDGLAEALADRTLAVASLLPARRVLEGVVEQGGDRFVGAAAALDHEALNGEEVG